MNPTFRIRESHLKRAPFGIATPDGPLTVNGKLARFASWKDAQAEAFRRSTILRADCVAMPLDRMYGVQVYGLEHVLASSGTR